MGCVEFGEGLRETVEGAAQDRDIVGSPEIEGKSRSRRELFKVLSEDLTAAAPALAVLHRVEEGFENVVGAIHQTDAAALGRDRNDVPPERVPVTVEVGQDQVDRLAHVFGRPALGTPLSQGGGKLFYGSSDVAQFCERMAGIDRCGRALVRFDNQAEGFA